MPDSITTVHINTERALRGGERQVLFLMRGLVERGHEASLIAQPDGALAREAEAAGLTVYRVRMRSEADLGAVQRIRAILSKLGPDIVHMHTGHAHTLGVAAAVLARRGRRVVSRRVISKVGRGILSRCKYRWGVDRYVAISRAVRDGLLAAGVAPGRVAVVPSCVDVGRFVGVADPSAALRREFGIPGGAPVVGSVGALCRAKGFRYLIEAVPLVVRRVPEVRFVLAGEGELREGLERRAEELAPGRVIFAGWRDDVPELLCFFDVFVSSSVEEGLGTTVMQALASRTPVVVTNAGGLPEVVEDGRTGRVVPAGDAAALADAVVPLLNDARLRATMADAGFRVVAERFTPDRMVEGTLAVYRDVLAGG